jgi:hypothetical protein
VSDAGLILELERNGEHLSEDELRELGEQLRPREPALFDTLGAPAVWIPIPRVGLTIFEYWGEVAEVLIATADGKVAQASCTMQIIDGEEVEIPDIPAGNPPGDELLRRLMELDLNLASLWIAQHGALPRDVSVTVKIVEW